MTYGARVDRARVWPDFRAEHILHADEDLVVVHKPAGVTSPCVARAIPRDAVSAVPVRGR